MTSPNRYTLNELGILIEGMRDQLNNLMLTAVFESYKDNTDRRLAQIEEDARRRQSLLWASFAFPLLVAVIAGLFLKVILA